MILDFYLFIPKSGPITDFHILYFFDFVRYFNDAPCVQKMRNKISFQKSSKRTYECKKSRLINARESRLQRSSGLIQYSAY